MDDETLMDTGDSGVSGESESSDSVAVVGTGGGSDTGDSTAPVQVISVDELIERLAPTEESETGEEAEDGKTEAEAEPPDPTPQETYFERMLTDTTDRDVLTAVQTIRQDIESSVHPAMTTQFADYTVTEALLLLALVGGVVSVCVRMLRRAFLWLT